MFYRLPEQAEAANEMFRRLSEGAEPDELRLRCVYFAPESN